jgi:hypothetical protein
MSVKDDQYRVDLKTTQDFTSATDLGVWWKLARPKKSATGGYSLEVRLLPSAPPSELESLVGLVMGVVNAVLRATSHQSEEKVLDLLGTPAAAWGIFQAVNSACPYLPARPLTADEWRAALYR